MKMNLQGFGNQLNAVSLNFLDRFVRIAEDIIHQRFIDVMQCAFAVAIGMLMSSVVVHIFFPEIGADWLDLVYKLGGLSAFLLLLFFAIYVTFKAGQSLDFSDEFIPKSALRALELPPQTIDAKPYDVIYQLPGESKDDFSLRARAVINKASHAVIIGFQDPLVVVKAGDESVSALRGEFPFEQSAVAAQCFEESYDDYIHYVAEFTNGFKRHMRACMASSAEFTLEQMYDKFLPTRIPSNFKIRFVQTLSIIGLLLLSNCELFGQTLQDVLGRRASEVPERGQQVSYIVDNGRALTYVADGVRNYVQLFLDNQGGLSKKARNFQMVIAGDEVVAKSDAIGHTTQATRVGASTEPAQTIRQIPPRVDVRPDAGIAVRVDPVSANQAIEDFKQESKSLFADLWAVLRAILRAFGQFIIFLMVLLRMFASQAANEMVSTYLGRIWGGSFILSALMTLSAFQMFMAWIAGGYLLCEWALYLAAANISTPLWFVLLLAGSFVIVKASKWFVVSPRDVVDGGKAAAGGRGMVIRD